MFGYYDVKLKCINALCCISIPWGTAALPYLINKCQSKWRGHCLTSKNSLFKCERLVEGERQLVFEYIIYICIKLAKNLDLFFTSNSLLPSLVVLFFILSLAFSLCVCLFYPFLSAFLIHITPCKGCSIIASLSICDFFLSDTHTLYFTPSLSLSFSFSLSLSLSISLPPWWLWRGRSLWVGVWVVVKGCGGLPGESHPCLPWPWQRLLINHPGIPAPHGPVPGRPYGWTAAVAIIAKGNTASKRAHPT